VAPVPHGHWHTTTFLCGLRQDGLVAPLVLDGAINGAAFLAYVEQMLCPTLRPGDIVICDNLGSHKISGVRQAIEARAAALQSGSQPDRTRLQQAQGPAAISRRTHRRCALVRHRPAAATVLTR
jgi:hypothetical protein